MYEVCHSNPITCSLIKTVVHYIVIDYWPSSCLAVVHLLEDVLSLNRGVIQTSVQMHDGGVCACTLL